MNLLRSHICLFVIAVMSISAAVASPGVKYQREAKEVAQEMAQQLGAVMKQKMQEGGPVAAIAACSVDALRISGELSRETGWMVKRVGTKVRNPLLGIPDEWEQKVLADFERRLENGEPLKAMAYGEMRKEENGHRYFRVMKAIGVKPQCLSCHGDVSAMPDEVREAIESAYPHDKAVGYQSGELRGAISIKRPL